MNRLSYKDIAPAAFNALLALETQVRKSGLEPVLKELVYLRVSQLNGCAYCIDMHVRALLAAGQSFERLMLVGVWREAPGFDARERAALEWAEAVTTLGPHGVPDDVYERVRGELGEVTQVQVTLAAVAINAWNRMNVAFRTPIPDQPAT